MPLPNQGRFKMVRDTSVDVMPRCEFHVFCFTAQRTKTARSPSQMRVTISRLFNSPVFTARTHKGVGAPRVGSTSDAEERLPGVANACHTGPMGSDAVPNADEVEGIVAEVSVAFDALILGDDEYRSSTTIASAVREKASDGAFSLLVAEALDYGTATDRGSDRRRVDAGPFVPMVSWIDEAGLEHCIPPLPLDQPDSVRACWSILVVEEGLPSIVKARLADLLWVVKYPANGERWFRVAIESYIASVDQRWGDTLEVRDGLFRARELSLETSQPHLRQQVDEQLSGMLNRSVASSARAPGLEIPILKLLGADGSLAYDLSAALVAAKEKYASDPWSMESLLELESRSCEGEEREAILSEAVHGFEQFAAGSEGLQSVAMLQKAAELAALHGLTDDRDRIRAEIGSRDPKEFLQPIRAEASIEREAIDEVVGNIVGEDSFRTAMRRLGSDLSTGKVEDARSFVAELAQSAPLQRMFPSRVLGEFNETVFVASSREDHDRLQLAQNASQNLLMHATFIVGPALLAALLRYDPDWDEIRSAFETEVIEAVVAQNVAHAIVLWRDGEWNLAASLLIPYLERAVRRLARLAGRPVTRDADPSSRARLGGVLTLGSLLTQLEAVLDESVVFFLRSALTDQLSLNIRNRWAHGLIDEVPEAEVLVLIQIFSLLTNLSLVPAQMDRSGFGNGRA